MLPRMRLSRSTRLHCEHWSSRVRVWTKKAESGQVPGWGQWRGVPARREMVHWIGEKRRRSRVCFGVLQVEVWGEGQLFQREFFTCDLQRLFLGLAGFGILNCDAERAGVLTVEGLGKALADTLRGGILDEHVCPRHNLKHAE